MALLQPLMMIIKNYYITLMVTGTLNNDGTYLIVEYFPLIGQKMEAPPTAGGWPP